jgi:uncharacterized protein
MLRFDIRALREGELTLREQLDPTDPAFRGLEVRLVGPVTVEGALAGVGHGAFAWRGGIRGTALGECRRCLAEVQAPFVAPVEVVFSPLPDAADDPSVYPLAASATELDLTEVVREEVGLAAPAYPLCRDTCAGLCPRCGENRNEGPCACARKPEPV